MDIINTKIYQSAIKIFPDYFDMEHYCDILFKHKENEWFIPTNKEEQAFQICKEMSSLGLICEKSTPVFYSGSYRGKRTEFLYSKNLEYKKEGKTEYSYVLDEGGF